MNAQTIDFVKNLIAEERGDKEAVARFLSRLHIGGIKTCRALIAEATAH